MSEKKEVACNMKCEKCGGGSDDMTFVCCDLCEDVFCQKCITEYDKEDVLSKFDGMTTFCEACAFVSIWNPLFDM